MNAPKIAPTATNTLNPVASAKTTLPAALALGLLGALFALTPAAIGKDDAAGGSANVAIRMIPLNLSESAPIPTRIVVPSLSSKYQGNKLEMTFHVDKSGRPYDVGSFDILAPRDLIAQLSSVIVLWRFEPARDVDGNPLDRKVKLPVSILPPKDGNEARVAFSYTK